MRNEEFEVDIQVSGDTVTLLAYDWDSDVQVTLSWDEFQALPPAAVIDDMAHLLAAIKRTRRATKLRRVLCP